MILPSLCFVSHSKHSQSTSIIQPKDTMASHKEISRLTTNMNTITGSGRPLRNSQGICSASQHPTRSTTPLSEAQSVPVNPQFPRSVLTKSGSHQASDTPNTLPSKRQFEALTPCVRQIDSLSTLQVTHFSQVP